jgi:hypothetical protein
LSVHKHLTHFLQNKDFEMKLDKLLAFSLLIVLGLAISVSRASAQFAYWSTTTNATDVSYINNGSSSEFTTTLAPVSLYYDVANGSGFGQGSSDQFTAYLTITGTVSAPATSGPNDQNFSSITMSFTNAADTVNYLTATVSSPGDPSNDPDIFNANGAFKSDDFSSGGTSPQSVTFSSDYLNFGAATNNNFDFSVTAAKDVLAGDTTITTPAPTINANGYFDSFVATGAGQFGTLTTSPTPAPEAGTAISFGVVMAGLLGMVVLRKKKASELS